MFCARNCEDESTRFLLLAGSIAANGARRESSDHVNAVDGIGDNSDANLAENSHIYHPQQDLNLAPNQASDSTSSNAYNYIDDASPSQDPLQSNSQREDPSTTRKQDTVNTLSNMNSRSHFSGPAENILILSDYDNSGKGGKGASPQMDEKLKEDGITTGISLKSNQCDDAAHARNPRQLHSCIVTGAGIQQHGTAGNISVEANLCYGPNESPSSPQDDSLYLEEDSLCIAEQLMA